MALVGCSIPCHCEGVRSTLKTLAYDCGNPVQYVCGHSPAVLFFYLLDRHALLAMTMGSKWIITHSLTTPGCAHPSNGGEPGTYRRGIKFPSAEGWRLCRRGGHCAPPPVVLCTTPPARGGGHFRPPQFVSNCTLATHCAGPGGRWALFALYTLHSNKKRGGAPFFILFRLLV